MRVIKSDSGFLVYQKVFKFLQSNASYVDLWQHTENGGRQVLKSRLNSFHLDSKLLHFELQGELSFAQDRPVYCYSNDGQFIFKSELKEIRETSFSIQVPDEIKFLEGQDTGVDQFRFQVDGSDDQSDVMVVKSMKERTTRDQKFLENEFHNMSLDEEDRLFADKRESPRARPKVDKWVKVKTIGSDEVHLLKLFDLSQGGIGFITMEPLAFPKGLKIMILGFTEFDLDDPLVGQIMSHRPVDETLVEYKIGCRFDEGQD